jgi:hypothetical protein
VLTSAAENQKAATIFICQPASEPATFGQFSGRFYGPPPISPAPNS